jgi:tetratricopeptide (TPR) repeat protein
MASAAAALALGVAALSGGSARAAVTVLGGGMAQDCSRLALSGEASAAAISICDLALEQEDLTRSDTAKTYINRAVMQLRRGALVKCRNDLASAERIQPSIPEIYVNRGALYIYEKRYTESIAEIDRGLAMNPVEPEKAYFNRGLAREGLDDAKGAYLDYRKAAQIKPDWPDAARAMARFTVLKN